MPRAKKGEQKGSNCKEDDSTESLYVLLLYARGSGREPRGAMKQVMYLAQVGSTLAPSSAWSLCGGRTGAPTSA